MISMGRQLPCRLALGDVSDVEAYVRRIAMALAIDEPDEIEELVADGLELVSRKHAELSPGASLQLALGGWLEARLRDRWRKRHPEWRRNTRAATAYSGPVATGPAWEHGGFDEVLASSAPNDSRLIQSRLSHASVFQSEADLLDPRRIGRYGGKPSLAALATGQAREIWATTIEERRLVTGLLPSQPTAFTVFESGG